MKYLLITTLFITLQLLGIWLHDNNVRNQCNKKGYTDALLTGKTLSCLEVKQNL